MDIRGGTILINCNDVFCEPTYFYILQVIINYFQINQSYIIYTKKLEFVSLYTPLHCIVDNIFFFYYYF